MSPAIQELHAAAAAAGICIMNEVGVDPGTRCAVLSALFEVCFAFLTSPKLCPSPSGIDHMSALRLIKGLQGRGGKVTRFVSLCGGLPAPEAADNPIGYKFSWSPIGVLRAATNVSHTTMHSQPYARCRSYRGRSLAIRAHLSCTRCGT